MFGYIVWTRRSYQLLQQNQNLEQQPQPQPQQQQQPPPPPAAADHRGQGAVPAVGAKAAGAAGAAVGADAARVAAARAATHGPRNDDQFDHQGEQPINANDPSIVPPPPPSTTTSTWSLGPGTSTSRDPLTESTTQRKKRFLSMSGGTSFGLGCRGSSGNSVKNNDNNLKETEMKTISLDD